MKNIGENEVWTYCDQEGIKKVDRPTSVRNAPGHVVQSYLDLATKIAELQYRNPDQVLLFRGQRSDRKNEKGNSTLKPSIFRSEKGSDFPPGLGILEDRYAKLEAAEKRLIIEYYSASLLGGDRLARHRILRWSILQHYEICPTPLLDVTHSLRIAASFASDGAENDAYIYVLGVPYISGAITASAEAGIQIVRLSSVCPPTALRPHIQEGYLLGEYPELVNLDQKELYGHYEVDFGRRLIAKFKFSPAEFWKDPDFPKVSRQALYPLPESDRLAQLAEQMKNH